MIHYSSYVHEYKLTPVTTDLSSTLTSMKSSICAYCVRSLECLCIHTIKHLSGLYHACLYEYRTYIEIDNELKQKLKMSYLVT